MTDMNQIEIIVAVDRLGGFGKAGKIPWHFPEDFKHFQETTKGHVCVMGRRTYEDMLEMRRARMKDKTAKIKEILPNRTSFVLSSNPDLDVEGATVVPNLRAAVQAIPHDDQRKIFVLGGQALFVEALAWAGTIHMTVIDDVYDCDRFFPVESLAGRFGISDGRVSDKLHFMTYKRIIR